MAAQLQAQYSNMGADMLNDVKSYITQGDSSQWERLPKGVSFLFLHIFRYYRKYQFQICLLFFYSFLAYRSSVFMSHIRTWIEEWLK